MKKCKSHSPGITKDTCEFCNPKFRFQKRRSTQNDTIRKVLDHLDNRTAKVDNEFNLYMKNHGIRSSQVAALIELLVETGVIQLNNLPQE